MRRSHCFSLGESGLVIELAAISLFLAPRTHTRWSTAVCGRTRALPRAVIILAVYLVPGSRGCDGRRRRGRAQHGRAGGAVRPPNAPRYAADLRHNGAFRHYDNRYHITAKLLGDLRRLPQLLGRLSGPLEDVTVQAFSFIGQLVTVLALAFLLILHGRDYVDHGAFTDRHAPAAVSAA